MCTNSCEGRNSDKDSMQVIEDDTQNCRYALEMTGSIVPILRVESFNFNHPAYFTASIEPFS